MAASAQDIVVIAAGIHHGVAFAFRMVSNFFWGDISKADEFHGLAPILIDLSTLSRLAHLNYDRRGDCCWLIESVILDPA